MSMMVHTWHGTLNLTKDKFFSLVMSCGWFKHPSPVVGQYREARGHFLDRVLQWSLCQLLKIRHQSMRYINVFNSLR